MRKLLKHHREQELLQDNIPFIQEAPQVEAPPLGQIIEVRTSDVA